MSEGAKRIAIERGRQIAEEGWTSAHDAEHDRGELAAAAACYAIHGTDPHRYDQEFVADAFTEFWPFDLSWWKPGTGEGVPTRIRRLEKAGALIAAEIDRLLREEESGP